MDINETIAAVRKARFVDAVVIGSHGDKYVINQRDFEKATPVVDIGDWLRNVDQYAVTEQELAKLFTLKPTDVLVGEYTFGLKAVANAKPTKVLQFPIGTPDEPARWTAQLTLDGVLKIGCQTHTLDTWAGDDGEDAISDNIYYVHVPEMKDLRDALVPILRQKLAAELAKQQPATLKKAA